MKHPKSMGKQDWHAITDYLLLYESANSWLGPFMLTQRMQLWYAEYMTKRLLKKIGKERGL